jgi:hypothetical protein
MPKEEIIKFHLAGKFKPEEMILTGSCFAKEVTNNIWYTKGVYITPAMRQKGIPQVQFESFLYLATDPYSPAVKNFSPQYVPCSFMINGVASKSRIGNKRDCRGAEDFFSFRSKVGI